MWKSIACLIYFSLTCCCHFFVTNVACWLVSFFLVGNFFLVDVCVNVTGAIPFRSSKSFYYACSIAMPISIFFLSVVFCSNFSYNLMSNIQQFCFDRLNVINFISFWLTFARASVATAGCFDFFSFVPIILVDFRFSVLWYFCFVGWLVIFFSVYFCFMHVC